MKYKLRYIDGERGDFKRREQNAGVEESERRALRRVRLREQICRPMDLMNAGKLKGKT